VSESDSKDQALSVAQLPSKPLKAELDGVLYELRRETIGEEYLLVREMSVAVKDGVSRLDPNRYEHANLFVRLLCNGEKLVEEELLKLPRTHYQTLATLAIQLDNEESGIVSDFLSPLLTDFPAYRSALAKLSGSPRSGSGRTSKSTTDGKNDS